jgi:hypothetical protein
MAVMTLTNQSNGRSLQPRNGWFVNRSKLDFRQRIWTPRGQVPLLPELAIIIGDSP